MKASLEPDAARITLSRRNLIALLVKLSIPDAKVQIEKWDQGVLVTVHAEPDHLHYDQFVLPGPMSSPTEKLIKVVQKAIDKETKSWPKKA